MPTVLGPYIADETDLASGLKEVQLLGVWATFVSSGDPASPHSFRIYDNTTNTGTKLLEVFEAPNQPGENQNYSLMFPKRLSMSGNLSLDITTAGGSAVQVWILVE